MENSSQDNPVSAASQQVCRCRLMQAASKPEGLLCVLWAHESPLPGALLQQRSSWRSSHSDPLCFSQSSLSKKIQRTRGTVHLLVHSRKATKRQVWARLKPGTGNSVQEVSCLDGQGAVTCCLPRHNSQSCGRKWGSRDLNPGTQIQDAGHQSSKLTCSVDLASVYLTRS